MSTLQQPETKPSRTFTNPMIRKLNRIEEQNPDHAVTYGGVAGKTAYFMVMAALGMIAYFPIHNMLAVGEAMQADSFTFYPLEGAVALLALLISALSPFLAFLIRPLVPVLGTLYCVSVSYSITWLAATAIPNYSGLISLALGITIILVAVMAILYATGAIKVGKRFRAIALTLFITVALGGIIGAVLSLIPGLGGIIKAVQADPIFSAIAGVIYIIIACAMLLVDFDSIQHAVEHQLPKKYEWVAAFGLAYTIIFLFLKVFSLLASSKSNNSTGSA